MKLWEVSRGATGGIAGMGLLTLAALSASCGGGGSTGAASPASSNSGSSATAASVSQVSCTGNSEGAQMYCTAVGSNLPEGMQFSATGCSSIAEAPNGNSSSRSFVCTPQQAGMSTVGLSSGGESLWSSAVQITERPTVLGIASAQGVDKTVVVRSDGNVWLLGRNYRDGTAPTGPLIIGSGYLKAAATEQDVVAIKADGSMWDLQAADGGVPKLGAGFVEVRGGVDHFLALKADGSLWAWGNNDVGQVGTGGSATASFNTPQVILQNVVAFDAGDAYSVAVKADGTVWAWGDLGWTASEPSFPIQLAAPTQIAVGYTKVFVGGLGILGLRADGTLWSLHGDRNATNAQVASHVIAASGSLVLLDNGSIWQAQDSTAAPWALSPVAGLPSSMVAVDNDFTANGGYAIDDTGQLWGWGSLADGRLGGDAATFKTSPTVVGNVGAAPPKSLAAGKGGLLVVDSAGVAYQFGVDVSQCVSGPSPCGPALPLHSIGAGFSQVALGEAHAAVIQSDGSLWTWGWNQDGQLGVGDTELHAGMQRVGNGYVSVAATAISTLALKTDGTLWAWGQTTPHDGVWVAPTLPQQIGSDFRSVSGAPWSALALKTDGSIWGWGYGPRAKWFGYTPVHVGDGFVQVAAGDSEWLALKADGTAWALSDDTPPVMVQIASNVQQVASNGDLAMLLYKDGSLWTWDGDFYGDLGNGTTGGLTPVPQRIATNITAFAAGYGFAAAVDANGNVLAWGSTGVPWPGSPTTQTPAVVDF